ncbi:Leucine-rich repeat receptor-like protein kinase [Quillaja saponaria]|uniref:Leucine-rich repeat receptor-like protein kinase n=1 Tax=Quillaja saponaria TaxID=32244 RepID=A0AAD7Q5J4_QUISA|nr:Leucine-rich repeat receptor-like protein kinase [Quillaja saponaria]
MTSYPVPVLLFVAVVTLPLLLVSQTSLAVFESINCGSSHSYTDENFITWRGDDTFFEKGQSRTVMYLTSELMSTLRIFPTRKKNCYSIFVDHGEKVLVRASFYYGNYDSKSSPPIFDLHLDGNYWDTVNTSSYYLISREAIYVPEGNYTSICVAQIRANQLPFISALEVRSIDRNFYSHVDLNHALFLKGRYALGTNQTVRYPKDVCDRIWYPGYGTGLLNVKNEALAIDVSAAEEHPPEEVLENAVINSSTRETILLFTGLPPKEVSIYIITYFSEVQFLQNEIRSLQIYIDDKPFSNPIIPPYGSVVQVSITNMTASANSSFVLKATSDSSLPPVLNCFEVYTISDALTEGTDSRDGRNRYLNGYNLSGLLPDFSSMDALQIMNLSYNRFSGSLPTSLKDKNFEFDASNNCLSGTECSETPLPSGGDSSETPSPPQGPPGPPPPSSVYPYDFPMSGGSRKIDKLLMLLAFIQFSLLSLLLVNIS